MTKDTKHAAREQARAEVLRRYDTRVADFDFAVESRRVITYAGEVHLLITGPDDAPPLMIFHGASENAILMIDWFGPALLDGYRCHWVDIPGEPGRSEGPRPKYKDNGYARWVVEVLDDLDLKRVGMIGYSLGGFAMLQTCAYAPERVSAAMFVVPGGFDPPNKWIGWGPLVETLLMTMQPSLEHTRRFVEEMTGPGITLPGDHIENIYFQAQVVEQGFSGRPKDFYVSPEAMSVFRGPAVVIVGAHDHIFDSEAILAAARKGLSGLRQAVSLPDEGHIFGPDGVEFLRDTATELFERPAG